MSIKVIVDGNNIIFPDQQPRIVFGTTGVPISLVLQEMGYSITDWSLNNLGNARIAPTGTMIAEKGSNKIIIDEAKQIFISNGLRFSYESLSYACVVGGRVMLPLRKVLESLGCEVHWEKVGDDDIITVITNPQEYTVNFDPNGGEISSQNESLTVLSYTPLALPVPTRKGYVFEGWYTEKEDGTRIGGINDEFTVRANLTLYARWISIVGYFKIMNAEGKYLTYVGCSDDALTVESDNNSTTQIWKIECSSEDNKYHIRPAKFNTFAMNVFRLDPYPCTIQPTKKNISDTSFSIMYMGNSDYNINWKNYEDEYKDHYLAEGNGTVGDVGKAYWICGQPQEWTLEPTSYTPPEPSIPSEYSRIRYGSTSGSNYENVVYDKGYGFNLENLKFKQKNDWTGIPLEYAGTSMKFALEQGYSCVLYSYAMVLYALGATVTKYDYRTNKIEEIVADPYSCLMANIGAEGDWSEAQSGEITINEGYFYDNPSKSPVNVAPYRITGAFNKSYDQVNLNRSGTVEAARENAEVITEVLAEHPEGVIVRNGKNSHSFVVVGSTFDFSENYTTVDEIDSCFTVYDSAGVNGGGPEGGIKFETSWSYSDGCRFSNLFRYDIIV